METLPQELVDKIAAHVHDGWNNLPHQSTVSPQPPPHSRVALACISRRWQYAFERRSFRSLQIKSNELEEFDTSKVPSFLGVNISQVKSSCGPPLPHFNARANEQPVVLEPTRHLFIPPSLTTEDGH